MFIDLTLFGESRPFVATSFNSVGPIAMFKAKRYRIDHHIVLFVQWVLAASMGL